MCCQKHCRLDHGWTCNVLVARAMQSGLSVAYTSSHTGQLWGCGDTEGVRIVSAFRINLKFQHDFCLSGFRVPLLPARATALLVSVHGTVTCYATTEGFEDL